METVEIHDEKPEDVGDALPHHARPHGEDPAEAQKELDQTMTGQFATNAMGEQRLHQVAGLPEVVGAPKIGPTRRRRRMGVR